MVCSDVISEVFYVLPEHMQKTETNHNPIEVNMTSGSGSELYCSQTWSSEHWLDFSDGDKTNFFLTLFLYVLKFFVNIDWHFPLNSYLC